MIQELLYAQGAKKLVEVNAQVKAGEKVLIVADYNMEKIAQRVARAASACGAEVVLSFMAPREWDQQEPPSMLAAAMLEADVVFTPVSVSIAWTNAITAARKAGARSILMTAFNDDIFTTKALIDTDFVERAKICEKLAEYYTPAETIRLTTPYGTDLTFTKKGRGTNLVTSIPKPGQTGSSPNIEINVVPTEGTTNGRLVVDGSIPYLGIGVLKEPIECTIKDGYVTEIKGGDVADLLNKDLASFNDKSVYAVAEFGVGLNPNAHLCGVMLEDEGVFGSVHVAIGTNIALGGDNVSPIHYDFIVTDVTIALDGKVIQKGKDFFFD
ncbi:aminopeptidase [Anaerotruncus rubiinfantis]|uniref:aminopeptidase n=1 Tax=Anaerotruncus rubiinfantis TaxID=1720200 RepID=UPI0011C9E418|nr:aminopeptidase [Anaerotruncus rubiinfantis]